MSTLLAVVDQPSLVADQMDTMIEWIQNPEKNNGDDEWLSTYFKEVEKLFSEVCIKASVKTDQF